ncbi:hypothetical protein FM076_11670 [Streptomyces albus subsp. chlorinus]|uniref:hypothetical protein n=1 Tax=Streptomyces albus TaxID=1888 RepID=UPI00156FE8F1|nr:hypothetical protein [Streptomyces albus]NSC21821.1 hypothetical protein [Streptomyces albus subsp. chlorinus]
MTVEIHGSFKPYPWLERAGEEEFRDSVLDLAMQRADAYGWHAPYGWRSSSGRKFFQVPDRWADCDRGGDWSGRTGIRALAWLRADIPDDVLLPRLPVLPMARVLTDALERAGEPTVTALRTYLPLQITAGDAEGDWEDMRDWFGLADPSLSVDVLVTVSAAPSSAWGPQEASRVRRAVQDHFGTAAEVAAAPQDVTAYLAATGEGQPLIEGARPAVRLLCRVREWSPDVAVWLVEVTGDALKAAGHTIPVIVTASRAQLPAAVPRALG